MSLLLQSAFDELASFTSQNMLVFWSAGEGFDMESGAPKTQVQHELTVWL